MDSVRYFLGVLLVVSFPPAVIYWLIVHPLVGLWRRIGPFAAYSVVVALCVLIGFGCYHFRRAFLGADLGTRWGLVMVGLVLYALSAWITVLTRRQLNLRTFAGLPELLENDPGSVLLQEGVYGVVRHPRYLSVVIGSAGFAMVVNYLGAYLVILASIPALLLVVTLEERELSVRFGADFERYRARVPAFFPAVGKSLHRSR